MTSTRRGTVRRLRSFRTPAGSLALLGLSVLLVLAVVGSAVWGHAATHGDLAHLSEGSSGKHWFGTDAGGRDIFARTMAATRRSLLMALAASAIGVSAGTLLGCAPVVCGRRVARALTAALNLALAFPSLLLVIILSVLMGTGGLGAVVAIGVAMVPSFGRLTQTLCAAVAGRDFVLAARVLGVPRWRILARHVLPNVREPLLVNASLCAAGAVGAFAGLSFLGLGVQPPAYDWGRLLNEGVARIYIDPLAAVGPASAVIFAGVTFMLLSEAVGAAIGAEARIGPDNRQGRNRKPGPDSGIRPPNAGATLDVDNLTVTVPRGAQTSVLVDGATFAIRPGEIVGVVGESGSGKSMLCLAVAGLLDHPVTASARHVEFDGEVLLAHDGRRVRPGSRSRARHLGTRMAFVFQDPMASLNPALRVGAQVAENGVLHQSLSRRLAHARAVDRLNAVRIPDARRRARQYPHELSGGMRQRAVIAMGLMGTPALIIADEPTTALDVTVQREVLGQLQQANRSTGCAIMLVSHDIAVVTSMCTRVMVMRSGRIVEDLPTRELVAGHARHPYTKALLAAVPTMTSRRGEPLAEIDSILRACDGSVNVLDAAGGTP